MDVQRTLPDQSLLYRHWKLYQLHAFLTIIEHRINQLPISLIKQIIRTIRYFIHGLSSTMDANSQARPETNDDDEQEHMDVETGRVRTHADTRVTEIVNETSFPRTNPKVN